LNFSIILLVTSKLIAVVLYTRYSASTSSPIIRSLTNTISKHTSTAAHIKYNIIILLTHGRMNLYTSVCVCVRRSIAPVRFRNRLILWTNKTITRSTRVLFYTGHTHTYWTETSHRFIIPTNVQKLLSTR